MTITAERPAATEEYTHQQILTILVGLMLGMFLAALDQTIVATAIRTIGDDLHGLSVQAWVTTAYLITSTITTPIYGKLGDLYGRKKLFLFAISVFITGSVACTFSTSMYMLAAFRAFQGIGAGGLFTLVLAIIGDLVPPRERARYTGYFMAVFGTSSVLGPVIGGFFAETTSIVGIAGWRWVFLVNVPIGILALFVVSRTLHLRTVRREARIDWWGAVALVVALVPLLTVAEQGRAWGWQSPRAVLCYGIGLAGLVGFVLVERAMGTDALIPLRIFRIRAASVTIIASVIVGMGMFGGITVLPLYLQIVHAATPMKSGLMMLPMVLGLMSAAIISGQFTSRTGIIRPFPIVGTLVATGGLALLWRVTADTSLPVVMAFMFVLGFGLGNCMQSLTLIVQNAVPPREIGVATAAATFFRQVGGTIGVAVFLSILFSTVGDRIATALQAAAPGLKAAVQADPSLLDNAYNRDVLAGNVAAVGRTVQDDSSIINRMSPVVGHPFKVGFAESIDAIFVTAAFVMFAGFIALLFLPHVELRRQSAQAAVAAEAANARGPSDARGEADSGVPPLATGTDTQQPSDLPQEDEPELRSVPSCSDLVPTPDGADPDGLGMAPGHGRHRGPAEHPAGRHVDAGGYHPRHARI